VKAGKGRGTDARCIKEDGAHEPWPDAVGNTFFVPTIAGLLPLTSFCAVSSSLLSVIMVFSAARRVRSAWCQPHMHTCQVSSAICTP
jgi:hypothetical protein